MAKALTKNEVIEKVIEMYRIQLNELTKDEVLALLNPPKATVKSNVNLEVFEPKAEAPKASSSTKKKNTKKSDDDFDRALYLSIGKKINALGKGGNKVSAPFREFVYAVMDGKMTEAQAKRAVENKRREIGWA